MWTFEPSEHDKKRMAFVLRHLERTGVMAGRPGPFTEEMVLRLALLDFALEVSECVHGTDDECGGK